MKTKHQFSNFCERNKQVNSLNSVTFLKIKSITNVQDLESTLYINVRSQLRC